MKAGTISTPKCCLPTTFTTENPIPLAVTTICLCCSLREPRGIRESPLIRTNIPSGITLPQNTGITLIPTVCILPFPIQGGEKLCGAKFTGNGSARLRFSHTISINSTPKTFCRCSQNITSRRSARRPQCTASLSKKTFQSMTFLPSNTRQPRAKPLIPKFSINFTRLPV